MKASFFSLLAGAALCLGLFSTPAHAASATFYDRLFNKADADKDHFISLDEYVASQPRSTRWTDAKWRFDYNDFNVDGFIDPLEYRASRGLKDGRRPSKLQTFLLADEDGDKVLDPFEYALTCPRSWPDRTVRMRFARMDRSGDFLMTHREFGLPNNAL